MHKEAGAEGTSVWGAHRRDVAQSPIEPREFSLGLELSAGCGLERMEEEKQGWGME